MFACLSTLRYRVLALSGVLIAATLLLGLVYALVLGRFEGHVSTFKNDNRPRFEATHQLEDWSYSILSGVNAFGAATSQDDLRTAYTHILDDIVSLEAAASDQFNVTGDVSSLELNRLIEGLKHSLNTTLALKSASFQTEQPVRPSPLSAQIAVNETILLQDLTNLRAHAIQNRLGAVDASGQGLIELQRRAQSDGQWVFGILFVVLVTAIVIASLIISRVRIGLYELSKVLRREQPGFSDKFLTTKDEFSEIADRVLHYIHQEKALREAQRQATESEMRAEAYEGAIANLTHDLRTPASQISGLLDLIEGQQDTGAGASNEVQMAQAAARRLNALIQDVLDLTRSEMGNSQPVTRAFDPSETFDELVASFRFTAQARGLDLVFDNRLAVTSVIQDDQRIARVVANLLDNAIKYTNSGRVTLSVSNRSGAEGRADLVIEVKDTGIGIPKEQLDGIFGKFERARNHYAIDGLGLGLALVSRFTDLLGGTVAVESEVNAGTCFTVTFPCEVMEERKSPLLANVSTTECDRKSNVLLVDDDPFNLALASSILAPCANVTCAGNGREAVDVYESGAFDLVIMDWRMPVLDGLAATREIRALEDAIDRRRTPIWGLTANASAEERIKAIDAGMQELLAKPLSKTKVNEMLACC